MITPQSIHEELLSPLGMSEIKQALEAKHPWVTHLADKSGFERIRAIGLEPRNLGEMSAPNLGLDTMEKRLGPDFKKIVCATPCGMPRKPYNDRFEIAIRTADLPDRMGFDNSSVTSMPAALKFRLANPQASAADVFFATLEKYSSVAIYDHIRPKFLRVRMKNSGATDYAAWLPINELNDLSEAFVEPPWPVSGYTFF